jgi:hypothetical protein
MPAQQTIVWMSLPDLVPPPTCPEARVLSLSDFHVSMTMRTKRFMNTWHGELPKQGGLFYLLREIGTDQMPKVAEGTCMTVPVSEAIIDIQDNLPEILSAYTDP